MNIVNRRWKWATAALGIVSLFAGGRFLVMRGINKTTDCQLTLEYAGTLVENGIPIVVYTNRYGFAVHFMRYPGSKGVACQVSLPRKCDRVRSILADDDSVGAFGYLGLPGDRVRTNFQAGVVSHKRDGHNISNITVNRFVSNDKDSRFGIHVESYADYNYDFIWDEKLTGNEAYIHTEQGWVRIGTCENGKWTYDKDKSSIIAEWVARYMPFDKSAIDGDGRDAQE